MREGGREGGRERGRQGGREGGRLARVGGRNTTSTLDLWSYKVREGELEVAPRVPKLTKHPPQGHPYGGSQHSLRKRENNTASATCVHVYWVTSIFTSTSRSVCYMAVCSQGSCGSLILIMCRCSLSSGSPTCMCNYCQ